MKNKIVNIFIVVMFLISIIGAMYLGHLLFPKETQLPPKIIKPTVHELNELARQIAEPEIRKAKEYWENKAPVEIPIYIPGIDSIIIETKLIYPTGSIDLTKTFDWSFIFDNDGRDSDSLNFTSIDSLIVTTYKDSTGAVYIGSSNFSQSIGGLKLFVNPVIYKQDVITPYSLFLLLGGDIGTRETVSNEVISKEALITLRAGIGVLINEDWIFEINAGVNKESQSIGVNVGKRIKF